MADLYPLTFEPIIKRYLWGGRRLGTELGKPIDFGNDFAESWEVVDHGQDQSIVASGPLKGTTLSELVAQYGTELFGRHAPQKHFPLLFKFLDCHQDLSVQVHPNDEAAARQQQADLGKTEAWVVLDAAPGSVIYAGLKAGVNRQAFEAALHEGKVPDCLHRIEPAAGDCIFIPAGTVHALGAGLLIAEIQQASDTTYRLFDWNRLGPDGRPRPLHVQQGLDVIDFNAGPVRPQSAQRTGHSSTERLATCDKFVLDRWRLEGDQQMGGDKRFHILSVIEGEAMLRRKDPADEEPLLMPRGQTVLIPAAAGPVSVATRGRAILLDMYLP